MNTPAPPLKSDPRDFAKARIEQCSAEILSWRKTGRLPVVSVLDELANLFVQYEDGGDRLAQAERLVILLALELAAGKPSGLVSPGTSAAPAVGDAGSPQ